MAPATAQLSLDGADRLVELLEERRAPVAAGEAARCLFALRSAPAPLVRQLVDEVVRADARLTWRSAGEVALAEWEEVASLVDLPLEQAPYVVFDLETTGTRPGVSRIVEVGAVRMHGFEAVETFHRLVDPGVPIPQTITRITGITRPDVRGAPRIGRVLTEFRRFAAGAVLVAHNARFDVGFVDAELSRLRGGRLTAPVIDTVALARRFLEGRLPRMNLGTLAERFDTEVRPCHRALPDAQATAEILAVLLGMAQERGARTVGDALGFSAPIARRARTRREPGARRADRPRRLPVPRCGRAGALRGQGVRPARTRAVVLRVRPAAAAGGGGPGCDRADRDPAGGLRAGGGAARAGADPAAAAGRPTTVPPIPSGPAT